MTARYGVKVRRRRDAALLTVRAVHECPKCGKKAVKRQGNALWKCRSCSVVFAGGAYVPQTSGGAATRRALEGGSAKVA